MPGPLLVPLDGSSLAERAMSYAAAMARDQARRLLLLRVTEGEPSSVSAANADLEPGAERLRKDGVDVKVLVSSRCLEVETVAEVIVDVAHQQGCELIVMSSHGRSGTGRWLYGSVAEEVLRRSSIPVVVVSTICDRPWPTGRSARMLLPLDGSALAEQGLDALLAAVAEPAAELILLRVLPLPTADAAGSARNGPAAEVAQARRALESVADRLRATGSRVTVDVTFGSPARAITRVARELDVDLIAMATHGRSGLAGLVLGSVGTETLHRSHVPLLLLRPHSFVAEEQPLSTRPPAPAGAGGPLTFLVAVDLTDEGGAAIELAARLARGCRGRVVLMDVSGRTGEDARVSLQARARIFAGLDVSTRVQVQADGEEIAEAAARVAREVGADVLAVVSGRASFAQDLLRLSPCSVLALGPPSLSP